MQSSPIQSFPTLYKTTAGSTRVWIARIITATATYETEHGSFGGKMQLTQRVFTEGKNIGKKNETTPLQQCTAEITKKWADKKAKEGYVEGDQSPSVTSAVEPVLTGGLGPVYPMLAQTYDPVTNAGKKAGIKFPCYVQPKLDGLRCIMYCDKGGRVSVQSRTGGQFTTLDHIVSELGPYLAANPGLVLDGELYTDEIPFETLVGHIKRKKVDPAMLPEIRKIRYHVYDIIDDNKKTFVERLAVLASVPLVQQVDTVLVQTPEEVKTKFAEYVAAGYEGIMLRNTTGMYRQNGRSTDLQKYKEFQEAEYTITGFTQGEGRDAGAVIWTCSTDGNKQFSVRPRGTIEDRRALFIDGAQHIGKQLTVVFQELSEQNVPRFPVGKGIRDGY